MGGIDLILYVLIIHVMKSIKRRIVMWIRCDAITNIIQAIPPPEGESCLSFRIDLCDANFHFLQIFLSFTGPAGFFKFSCGFYFLFEFVDRTCCLLISCMVLRPVSLSHSPLGSSMTYLRLE